MINNPSCTIYSIYCITNLINQKKYIGFTGKQDPFKRIYSHCKAKDSTISKAIQKYSKENFKFEVILQGTDKEDVLSMETYFIKEYNTLSPNGYNMTTGGTSPDFSEKHKNNLSNAKLGSIPWNKGKKTPRDVRLKQSISAKGRTYSYEYKQKISNTLKSKNIKRSDEFKRNLSIKLKGRKHTEEQRKKNSNAKLGSIPWNKGKNYISLGHYKRYLIQLPNNEIKEINGLSKFCNDNNIILSSLYNTINCDKYYKGFKIIKKL